ncbi:Helicase associated domain [Seminavis robusta]|uniref:Helicase associated domain n=1 Tax=Seminavis robusta TaxID=568900 RepID=A0A9N8E7A2_9STRA|nr:Helicase associated domain [Seminavis robusta]|eukprot:Sro757_g197950.1 Helicase associated domain (460) ;mRNA; f:27452-28953
MSSSLSTYGASVPMLYSTHEVRERRSVRHWIEKDALKSLQHMEQQQQDQPKEQPDQQPPSVPQVGPPLEIGLRKAIVVGFSGGWTAAGINLTFGRYTTNPYPSITISDGKHEVKAYLTAESSQSSAFWARPTLSVGSMIQIEKADFVLESTLLPPPPETTDAGSSTKPDDAYVLAVRSSIQHIDRKPVLDLNKSNKLKQWFNRKAASTDPPEQPMEPAQMGSTEQAGEEKDDNAGENDDDDSTSSDSSTESEHSSAEGETEGGGSKKEPTDDDSPAKAVRRRKHKRTLIASGVPEPSPQRRPPPAKKQYVQAGRGRPSKLSWEEKVNHLIAYKAEHSHCNAPVGCKQGEFALGSWINQLRMGKGSLSEEQKKELDDLGFIWDMAEHNWQRNFQALWISKTKMATPVCQSPTRMMQETWEPGSTINVEQSVPASCSLSVRRNSLNLGLSGKSECVLQYSQ